MDHSSGVKKKKKKKTREHPDDEKKERENDRDIDSKLAILSRWTATLHIRSYRDYHQAKNTGSLSTPK
ncbi:hypothetical protein QQP08_014744 [Theobroma cacao]|nr:hypothetical protein QQP08_014744 [Theobroma cacao]